jgi:hypothetical protein
VLDCAAHHKISSQHCTAQSMAAAACGIGAEVQEPPALCCPVLLTLFRDPVFVPESGNTYDRQALDKWFASSRAGAQLRDPLTNTVISTTQVFTNWDKRREVNAWLEENPDYIPKGWASHDDMVPAEAPGEAQRLGGEQGRANEADRLVIHSARYGWARYIWNVACGSGRARQARQLPAGDNDGRVGSTRYRATEEGRTGNGDGEAGWHAAVGQADETAVVRCAPCTRALTAPAGVTDIVKRHVVGEELHESWRSGRLSVYSLLN